MVTSIGSLKALTKGAATWVTRRATHADDYLSKSIDVYDLERRQRQLERQTQA